MFFIWGYWGKWDTGFVCLFIHLECLHSCLDLGFSISRRPLYRRVFYRRALYQVNDSIVNNLV
jgi:hypothetical protein